MAQPSPHLGSFFGPWTPPPQFVPAPEDAAARDRIILLARYAMQNGASFIEMVRAKQAGNAQYNFLTPGDEHNPFYVWALYATGYNLPLDQPPPAVPPGAAAAASVPTPSAVASAYQQLPQPISSGFAQVVEGLTGSKVKPAAQELGAVEPHIANPACMARFRSVFLICSSVISRSSQHAELLPAKAAL